jgi:hypothetical protein
MEIRDQKTVIKTRYSVLLLNTGGGRKWRVQSEDATWAKKVGHVTGWGKTAGRAEAWWGQSAPARTRWRAPGTSSPRGAAKP